MTWWMVAGAVVSAYGAMQAGKARAAEARAKQAQLLEQKKDAEVIAMQEHNIRMSNLDALLGLNKSLAGVMGRDSGGDRSLKAIRDSAIKEAETEDSRARYQYVAEQSQRSMGVQLAGMQAKNAKRVGQINAVSSLLKAGHYYSKV